VNITRLRWWESREKEEEGNGGEAKEKKRKRGVFLSFRTTLIEGGVFSSLHAISC